MCENNRGQTTPGTNEIRIDKTLSPDEKYMVIAHEMTHQYGPEYNLTRGDFTKEIKDYSDARLFKNVTDFDTDPRFRRVSDENVTDDKGIVHKYYHSVAIPPKGYDVTQQINQTNYENFSDIKNMPTFFSNTSIKELQDNQNRDNSTIRRIYKYGQPYSELIAGLPRRYYQNDTQMRNEVPGLTSDIENFMRSKI
jgi:hypothetical protein